MRIDHVIYATRDLDATAARLEAEHGIVAKGGGRHTGLGTENRIFPLGGGYLELIAVADYAEAERGAGAGASPAGTRRTLRRPPRWEAACPPGIVGEACPGPASRSPS